MCEQDNQLEQAQKLAATLYGPFSLYHHHKELMGHAAVVVEGSLFIALMSQQNWRTVQAHGWLSSVIVTWLFLIIHVYMRWELRYRRLAADQMGGLRRTLARSTAESTSKPADDSGGRHVGKWRLWLWRLLDRV